MAADENTKAPRGLGHSIAMCLLLAMALAAVLAVALFMFVLVTDGIDARLIALDSYDPEQTKVWERQYTKEALRGSAIPGLILLSLVVILCAGMFRCARSAWSHFKRTGAEQGADAKPDNVAS